MDRLTRKENFDNEYLDNCVYWEEAKKMVLKLHKVENIMEKYGIESVEELEDALVPLVEGNLEHWKRAMYWKMQAEKLQHDRDTWKRACELVCEELEKQTNLIDYSDPIYTMMSFYTQAQKERKE